MAFTLQKPQVRPYTPTFEIDDGFRLASEPTLEAVCNDVRRWHEFSMNGADRHLLGVFMCGVALLRARDMVPRASRGDTVKGYNRDGFDAWKRVNFPDISERALGNYVNFAENVFLRSKHLCKTASVAVLGNGHKDFVCPTTKQDAGKLLAVLGTVMDGKTMTMLYRSIKRIREATPKEGNGLLGDPKAPRHTSETVLAKREQLAAESVAMLSACLDGILDTRSYEELCDSDLQHLRERLIETETAISNLATARRLKRLPDNWRLLEHNSHE